MSLIVYNNIQREYLRQENLSNKYPVCLLIKKAQEYFTLPRKGKRFLKVRERFIQFLIDQSIKYETVYGLQENIAAYLNCDVRHLRKVIKDLREQEWITVIDTKGLCNIYILNPIFQDRAFCIEMNYIFNNLLVDKELYRKMNISKNYHQEIAKREPLNFERMTFHEEVYDDERFRPKETDKKILDEIFDFSKMPSIYKNDTYSLETSDPFVCDDGATLETYTPYDFENEPVLTGDLTSFGGVDWFPSKKTTSITNQLNKPVIQPVKQHKKQPTKEQLVEENFLPISNQLKSIKLTKWGQIRLCCYPDEAILYADEQFLRNNKQISNPFKYFCGIAETWCKQYEIPIAWNHMFQLARENGMPDNGPFYDPNFIPVKPVNKPVKNQQQPSTPWSKYIEHNAELIEMYGTPSMKKEAQEKRGKNYSQDAKTRQQQRHQEEWEACRIKDPEKFARWESNAKQFREILGLNEDGTFKQGHTPEQAVEILQGIFK